MRNGSSTLAASLLAWVSLNGTDLLAQGCAMCKTVAEAQSREAAASLNLGILFLLVPPVAIMAGLLLFAFRRCDVPYPTEESVSSGGNDDVTSTAA